MAGPPSRPRNPGLCSPPKARQPPWANAPWAVLGKERIETIVSKVKALDYYEQQKEWVKDVMKKGSLHSAVAAIVKKTVLNKVIKIFGAMDVDLKPVEKATGDSALDELFAPQFFQHGAKAGEVTIGTTYGLVDVRICLDGELIIIGVPFKELTGDTLKAKFGTALATSSEAFLNLAKVKGFVSKVTAGSGLVIPNGYVMAAFSPGDHATHGIRYQFVGTDDMARANVEFLTNLLAVYPTMVGETAHGKLLASLKTVG